MKIGFKKSRFGVSIVLAALVGLGSCANPNKIAPYVPCPRVSLLKEAVEFTEFRAGGGRDVTDVAYRGRIMDIDFKCEQNEERTEITARAVVTAEFDLGPAAEIRNPKFPIFLALTDSGGPVIDKNIFDMKVAFRGSGRKAVATRTIKGIRIPAKGSIPVEAHEIFFGFQLSPAQVAYNRTKNAR